MDINQKHAASELHHVGKWRCIWHEGRYTIINPGGLEYELRTDEIEDFHLRSLLSDVFEGLEALQNENAALRERVAMLEGAAGADLADLAAAANAANAAKAEREADAAGYKAVIAELRAENQRMESELHQKQMEAASSVHEDTIACLTWAISVIADNCPDAAPSSWLSRASRVLTFWVHGMHDESVEIFASTVESATLRANGFQVEGE